MAEIISNNIYLIFLLPLWIFLIIMIGRFFSVYVNKHLVYGLTLLSSSLGAVSCGLLLYLFKPDMAYEVQTPFIKINDFIISGGIHIDRISLIFGLILFLVSFLVQIFSISYMKSEKKEYRFYGLINLFNFSLAGLFFSPNLYQTYVFWEIAGVISYLLIGFDYFKSEKSLASKKVFIINRIGDTALISAIVLSSYFMYEYSPAKSLATLSYVDMNIISAFVSAYTSEPLFIIICVLFIIAAIAKSAQIPFYTWLQDAMEAKLPVSALLHSATIVALGIYLLIRVSPFLVLSPVTLKLIAIVGLVTLFVCSLSACAQTQPKKALAYSTSAQFGLMFLALGVGNIPSAIALFSSHAVIKPALFLSLPDENQKWSYLKFASFIIFGLSLAGIGFSEMVSKEMLMTSFGQKGMIILCLASFLTAFYILRIAFVTAKNHDLEKSDINFAEIIGIAGFFILNIGFYIYLKNFVKYQITEPFWFALSTCVLAYILYKKDAFKQVPVLYPLCLNGFYLDKFYSTVVVKTYTTFTNILNSVDTKILGNYKPIIFLSKLGVRIIAFVENNVMNKTVTLISEFSKAISKFDMKAQSGKIQRYNLYAFIIITVILSTLLIAYTAIITWAQGG